MTRQHSFKTRVRARMDKTGESYTTARRQLLRKADSSRLPERSAPADATADSAADSDDGVGALKLSDVAVREHTGRGWQEWLALLDAWGATDRTHTEIARWLVTEHEVPGWWAQSVAVTYEQTRGMRAPGQKSDGTFSAGASKTVAVPAERLFAAFSDESVRQQWLPDAALQIRTATSPKSLRADWDDGLTRIVVGVTPKGVGKAQVGLQHERLADAEAAAAMKTFWRERLAALKQLLES